MPTRTPGHALHLAARWIARYGLEVRRWLNATIHRARGNGKTVQSLFAVAQTLIYSDGGYCIVDESVHLAAYRRAKRGISNEANARLITASRRKLLAMLEESVAVNHGRCIS